MRYHTLQIGSVWHNGREVKLFPPPSETREVDLATFNGLLINRDAITAVGYPRADYFMQWWEHEYSLRLRRAGFKIWVQPEILVTHYFTGLVGWSLPWRGYYQTRNQLAMALDDRSAAEVFWWAIRQLKLIAGALLYSDMKFERIRLRALGALHRLFGKMGKTIDPAEYAMSKHMRS